MNILKASVCLAALFASNAAFAQVTPPTAPGSSTVGEDPAAVDTAAMPQAQVAPPGAPQPAVPETGLQDIVVTAQRRSENLQRVPIAITTISPALQTKLNIRDLQTMQIITPGLSVSTGVAYAMTYIRGVGASFSNPGVENPVGVYIDGAYVERGKGGNLDVLDTSSLQVLKGPQGTLWGRNSTGGAIIVTTADPTFKNASRLTGEFGNLDHRLVEGYVNVPLSETVAVRIAGRYRKEGGYIRNLPDGFKFGGLDVYTIRGKILFKPTSEFSAVLGVQHDSRKSSLDANAQRLPDAYCLLCSQSSFQHPYRDPYTTAINLINGGVGDVNKNDSYNLRLNYDLSHVSIASVTAFNKNRDTNYTDTDLTDVNNSLSQNFVIPSTNKTFVQNVTATTSFGGMFEGLAGVDYLNDVSTYAINIVQTINGPYPPANLAHIKTESISPYAEINFKPIEGVTITGGGRYTSDVRHGRRDGEPNQRIKFTSFSPRAVIAYDTGPVNMYASFNKGNKAGGFSSPAIPLQVFVPEKLDAYEVGLKFVSSDRRFRANIAAFHYDYNQLQTVAVDQGSGTNIGTIQNPDAKLNGIDADANWKPVEWFELFAGGTYLRSRYKNYTNAGVQLPAFGANGNVIGTITGTEDLSGFALPHAPRFTAFIGGTASAEVYDGWKGQITAFLNHSASFDFFPGAGGPLRADRQPSFETARMSGSITPPDGRYEIGFYIDNLTDAKTYNLRFTTAPFGAYELINRPRTYGLRVSVNY
jgi:iron complex outermembrane receptor protein